MKSYTSNKGIFQSDYDYYKASSDPLFILLNRAYLEESPYFLDLATMDLPLLRRTLETTDFVVRIREGFLFYGTTDPTADDFMSTCIEFLNYRFTEIQILEIETDMTRSPLRDFEGNPEFEERARLLIPRRSCQNEICPFTQENITNLLLFTFTDSRHFTWGFDMYSVADEISTKRFLKNPLTREYLSTENYINLKKTIEGLVRLGNSIKNRGVM